MNELPNNLAFSSVRNFLIRRNTWSLYWVLRINMFTKSQFLSIVIELHHHLRQQVLNLLVMCAYNKFFSSGTWPKIFRVQFLSEFIINYINIILWIKSCLIRSRCFPNEYKALSSWKLETSDFSTKKKISL